MSSAAVSHARATGNPPGGGAAAGAGAGYNSRTLYRPAWNNGSGPPPPPPPQHHHHQQPQQQQQQQQQQQAYHPPPQTSSVRGDWKLEQFLDKSSGQKKEIVVLADTPSPGPQAGSSKANGLASTRPTGDIDGYGPSSSKKVKGQNGEPAGGGGQQLQGFDLAAARAYQLGGGGGGGAGGGEAKFVKGKRKLDSYVSGQQQQQQQRDEERERKRKEAEKLPSCDDKEGHYIVRPDDLLDDRYKVVKLLGQGTFGKVVHAVDTKSSTDARTGRKREVAVKVIRAVQKYRDASRVEIKVLNLLRERDPNNINKCIHLLDCFDHRNHICIVSELLSQSVFDFLKDNQYTPFPPSHIQAFAKQLLSSVAFLHDLRLVHTDLKPENVLLVDCAARILPSKSGRGANKTRKILRNSDIRLIDFGSATFEEEYHASVVSTRHYRAPEIILGLGWSYPCDVWSIGCILIEFFTGEALFQTHENLEHLAMMQGVFGPMPDSLLRKAAKMKPEFIRNAHLDYPQSSTSRQSRKFVKAMRKLEDIVPESSIINSRFRNLLEKLLHWDPKQRISVRDALKHNYFALRIEDEGREAAGP